MLKGLRIHTAVLLTLCLTLASCVTPPPKNGRNYTRAELQQQQIQAQNNTAAAIAILGVASLAGDAMIANSNRRYYRGGYYGHRRYYRHYGGY